MNLIKKTTIERFAAEHADARQPLQDWASIVRAARWTSMNQVVALGVFSASAVGSDRIVFNIGGNKYRLICRVRFARPPADGVVFVLWFGTHAQHDRIDARTVKFAD
jgi:mRNA interferase HigB